MTAWNRNWLWDNLSVCMRDSNKNSNGYTNVFDIKRVKQHNWTDLNTAVCRGEWEIKDGGLKPAVWNNVYIAQLCENATNFQLQYILFLRSSNMPALVRILRILSYVRVSVISKMADCNRKWIHSTHLLQIYHTLWRGRVFGLVVMMLDAKNISISV